MSAVPPAAAAPTAVAPEEEIIDAAEILSDIQSVQKRFPTLNISDPVVKAFLERDLIPLIETHIKKTVEHENVLDEIAASQEMVSPETAVLILGALELGEQLAKFLEPLLVQFKNKEKARQGMQLVSTFRAAAVEAKAQVEALATDEDDGQDDDNGGDQSDDQGDGQ